MAYKMKGSPFQRNFGVGIKEAPEKESPLNRRSYEERQRAKAERLHARAKRREARTGLSRIFGTGKFAKRRAEKAEAKAATGSRKTWKKMKKYHGKEKVIEAIRKTDPTYRSNLTDKQLKSYFFK